MDSFLTALARLQDAMRLMVFHLGGGELGKPGAPPRWVRDQSALRLVAIHQGSMIAELAPAEKAPEGDGLGFQALRALRGHNPAQPALPEQVLNKLGEMRSGLPADAKVWLGDTTRPRQAEIEPPPRPPKTPPEREHLLLWGWLKEVNWAKNTAQLHKFDDAGYIRLRFDKELKDQMIKFATKHVQVSGYGHFKAGDKLDYLQVEEIVDTRSLSVTAEQAKNNPNPKIYYPDKAPTVDMDYEEYLEFRKETRKNRNLIKVRDLDA